MTPQMTQTSSANLPSARQAYICLAAGSIAALFINTRWNIPVMAWLSGLLVLRFMRIQRLRGQKTWKSYLLASAATAAALSIGLQGILPPTLLYPTAILSGFIGVLPYLFDRWLYWRFSGWWGTLVYPLAATAVEALNLSSSPLGSWGAMAYSQTGNLVVMQLVSLTGIWGLTLLISWFAAVVNWAWEQEFAWPVIRQGVLIYAGVLAAVLAYGGARLMLAPMQQGTLRVAGIVHELPTEVLGALFAKGDYEAVRQKSSTVQESYFADTLREIEAGAQLVLWPEGAMFVDEIDEARLLQRAGQLAQEKQVYLAIPMIAVHADKSPATNKLVLVNPSGQVAMQHVKYGGNFLEGTELGDGNLRTVETAYGVISGVICWDADFQAKITQAGRKGVGLLVVPSRDWREIDPMHSDMIVFRAIENGMAVFRLTEQGLSLAIDPYGRALARMDYFTASQTVMAAQMPAQHIFTLYPLIGDAFAWLSGLGFAAMAVMGWMRKRQQ